MCIENDNILSLWQLYSDYDKAPDINKKGQMFVGML